MSFKNTARSVDDLKDNIRENVRKEMYEACGNVVQALRWKIEKNDSDATGVLQDSLDVEPGLTGGTRTFARFHIIGAPHWKYLEYGTGRYTGRNYSAPEIAPYVPIYRWIVASGITPRPDGPADNQIELAHVIARSISTGTRPHPFARPVWRGPNGESYIKESVEDAVQDA